LNQCHRRESGSDNAFAGFDRTVQNAQIVNGDAKMSAVVRTLPTGLYVIADEGNAFNLRNVPPGDYELNSWIEGEPQSTLQGPSLTVDLSARVVDLGGLSAPIPRAGTMAHSNICGEDYG